MGFKTQREVDRLSLPSGVADRFIFDDQCQGLSVRLQGAKRSWVVHYAVDGKRRRMSLGDVAGISLADARKRAGQVVAGGRDGADPLKERAARARQTADTLGALVKLYLRRSCRTEAEAAHAGRDQAGAQRPSWLPLHELPHSVALDRRTVAARLMAAGRHAAARSWRTGVGRICRTASPGRCRWAWPRSTP